MDFITYLKEFFSFDFIGMKYSYTLWFLALVFYLITNKFLRKLINKRLKIYLYKRRRKIFYRFLFIRFIKITKPFITTFNFFLLEHTVSIFIQNEYLSYIVFLIYLFLFSWCSYQTSKFFIHINLTIKIRKKRINRRKIFYNLYVNVSKVLIFLVVFIILLSKIGVDLSTLLTSLGIGSAILAFSAKNTLTNFFDSLILVGEDAFRVGDWIQTKDIEGDVVEFGVLSTKIRTFENSMVTIPNSVLVHDYVKNLSMREIGRRIKFNLRLKFTNDTDEIDKVIKEIRSMLGKNPLIVTTDKIKEQRKRTKKKYNEDSLYNIEDKYGIKRSFLVYFDAIDKYSMNILVYAFSVSINWEDWLDTKEDVLKKVIQIIDNSSLELAYPKNEIILDKTSINATTVK
ncbi:MAG: MscS Mechanosensitive ion channel [uncultured Campylobacterales bacterium]|uniref:MscS Mechanosensitive ion channel n=1 Tax=uncultured Campylobacterales bacterium TaxID=352960 RepID=A0A6S6SV62_9BACT|nr:MAG: MscS Mechanosensitive ion channel [uncultured Campylobacterales bacterium]